MTTITKECLTKIIEAADEVLSALAGTNDDVHPDDSKKMCELWDDLNDRYAPPEVVKEMARMLLDAQEPVAYMHRSGQVVTREECCDDKIFAICCKVETPLYAAPQPLTDAERNELQQYRKAASEAVAFLWSHRKHKSEVTLTRPEDDERAEGALWSGWTCQALAPARPAPVVPDEKCDDDGTTSSEFDHGWNACRAAMLRGGKS
ncbi:hypothetical protein [Scandinavium sp. UTDF21-P1B]|uniref:hypothetical protein n=1 Tax=Scandinavium sp. UTDF21-P1B TaxID=3446379 RepID=UPI003F52F92F